MPYMEEFKNDEARLQNIQDQYFSFMFSRHPFDRLYSAYRNKFMAPDVPKPYYLIHFGPKILQKMGKNQQTHPKKVIKGAEYLNITFEEFLTYLAKGGQHADDHWAPQTSLCQICKYQFDFIGRFEHLNTDANKIFKLINTDLMFSTKHDYKQRTVDMLKQAYEKIPRKLLVLIYLTYKDDFDAFGYDPNEYFQFM